MRRGFALLALSLVLPTAARAHAFLERATPPVGSTLPASPPALVIAFSEDVEPAFSRIEVHDAAGARVDRDDLHTLGDGVRRLGVSLPKLSPGRYTVVWHVTSVDTHRTEGRFDFSVAP